MTFLINTCLGFLVGQIADILKRSKNSMSSPTKFKPMFFIKDTWQKILLSLILSFALSFVVHLNLEDFTSLVGTDWEKVNGLVYVIIGLVPELFLQYFKKKYGFLQPKNVEDFKRK